MCHYNTYNFCPTDEMARSQVNLAILQLKLARLISVFGVVVARSSERGHAFSVHHEQCQQKDNFE